MKGDEKKLGYPGYWAGDGLMNDEHLKRAYPSEQQQLDYLNAYIKDNILSEEGILKRQMNKIL